MQLSRDGLLEPPVEPAKIDIKKASKSFENGAKWFYAIAGLSLVNSVAHLARSNFTFVIGLGVTQIVDVIALAIIGDYPEISIIVYAVALIFNLLYAGVFALFGWLALKRYGWAFIVGLVLYVLDGLLFLLFQDWLSVGFHVLAFVCILNGYIGLRKIKQTEALVIKQQEPSQLPSQ